MTRLNDIAMKAAIEIIINNNKAKSGSAEQVYYGIDEVVTLVYMEVRPDDKLSVNNIIEESAHSLGLNRYYQSLSYEQYKRIEQKLWQNVEKFG